MKKLYNILILLVMIGTTSAAVYEITEPSDAKLFFTREMPQDSKMHTMIECGVGFTTRCDMGEMSGNTLNKRILNMNPDNTTFDGCVYFAINCSTGMGDTADGMEDFVSITYTCPNGTEYSCNDHALIGRVSPTSITITPPMEPYMFPPDMVEVYSDIEIVFVDGAYGDYELIAWTDHPPGEKAA